MAANIAFGVYPNDIDQSAVEHAAKIANLHDFVVNEMPEGYATTVGERGVRLSGGQRQRVAIARALVTNPDIVLADEPTANLDSETGERILSLMKELNKIEKTTFVFSTHDPEILQYANSIVKIRDGKIAG